MGATTAAALAKAGLALKDIDFSVAPGSTTAIDASWCPGMPVTDEGSVAPVAGTF